MGVSASITNPPFTGKLSRQHPQCHGVAPGHGRVLFRPQAAHVQADRPGTTSSTPRKNRPAGEDKKIAVKKESPHQVNSNHKVVQRWCTAGYTYDTRYSAATRHDPAARKTLLRQKNKPTRARGGTADLLALSLLLNQIPRIDFFFGVTGSHSEHASISRARACMP